MPINRVDYSIMFLHFIHFTDDGYTINQLIMSGVKMDKARRKTLSLLLQRYGVGIEGDELTTNADVPFAPSSR